MTPGVTVNQSMDDRIKEFRSDPEKMNVTTKFVDEVVEKAKDEALKRMKEMEKEGRRDRVQQIKLDGGELLSQVEENDMGLPEPRRRSRRGRKPYGRRKRGRWHSRARGFFSRLFASLCFCSTETQV